MEGWGGYYDKPEENGASAEPTGLSQVEPVSRLDPTGFDPLRVEVMERAIAAALRPYNAYFAPGDNSHLWIARRCADAALQAAIAMEARSGETGTGSTRKGDSAAIAQD